MDVVYPYKRTADEFELRYSLRSLVNLPHARTVIGGDKPRIVSDQVYWAGAIPHHDRFASSTINIVAAVEQCGIDGEFIVMNDDMFILEPWSVRHEHRGTIDEYLASETAKGGYRRRAEHTRDILRAHGVAEPLFFGLHTPTVYDASKILDLVSQFKGERYLLRTLYHNLFPAPATYREDVKVRQWGTRDLPADVMSVSDMCAFDPRFRAWIHARFPEPSSYEKPAVTKAAA
jgi:hypothetical protein